MNLNRFQAVLDHMVEYKLESVPVKLISDHVDPMFLSHQTIVHVNSIDDLLEWGPTLGVTHATKTPQFVSLNGTLPMSDIEVRITAPNDEQPGDYRITVHLDELFHTQSKQEA